MGAPISSKLLEDEPDIAELLIGFLNNSLPKLTNEIHRLADQGEWEKMAEAVHDLKGSSANYGFPLLADMAKLIEMNLKQNENEYASQLLSDLDSLVLRIHQGAPKLD